MKKLFLYFTLLLSFFWITNVYAFDTSAKIYDYSDKLTDEEEALLKEKIDTFIDTYHMDLVLVTVDEHNKNTTEEYADDFYDYNGFGIGETHDGLILVIDNNFAKENLWISTTGEAIRMYNDARINYILDAIEVEYNYYKLFDIFIDKCSYYASLGIPGDNRNTYIDENGDIHEKRTIPWFYLISFSSVVATIVLLILIRKNKMIHKAENANPYIIKDRIRITSRSDQFVSTHTSKVLIRLQNSSSGGGHHSVGGSTVHRGSSGISHGGGGRSR